MRCDYIVVGGGIVDVCAAYHLAAQKKEVMLLESASSLSLKSLKSSSGDSTKCFRTMYGADRHLIALSKNSLELWRTFQADSGQQLYTPCGVLAFGAQSEQTLSHWSNTSAAGYPQASISVMAAESLPVERLEIEAVCERYPQLHPNAAFDHAVLDVSAGILYATTAVRAVGDLAKHQGAEILTNPTVKVVEWDGERVATLRTNRGNFSARRAIVFAAGYGNPALTRATPRKSDTDVSYDLLSAGLRREGDHRCRSANSIRRSSRRRSPWKR